MIDTLINFLKDHAFGVTVILLITTFAHGIIMALSKRLIRRALRPEKFKNELEEQRRENTLISTMNAVVRTGVWIIGGLLLLAEFGIDIAPLLAGAGIAGVALGFGAQSMVKDFLAGFFILIENHYRVGDVVELNQTVSGVVEQVTLRETVLRDLDGMVHHIPNGEITIATNMTLEFSGINLNLGVGYDTDLEKLEKVVNEVGEKLASDADWQDKIIVAPHFLRVDDFADSSIMIKITGKTEAMQQWVVTGELRKRLKIAFDKNDIEIPFPQRVIHEARKPKPKK
jgi:small-conductance mechanosensitive channel